MRGELAAGRLHHGLQAVQGAGAQIAENDAERAHDGPSARRALGSNRAPMDSSPWPAAAAPRYTRQDKACRVSVVNDGVRAGSALGRLHPRTGSGKQLVAVREQQAAGSGAASSARSSRS